MFGGNQDQGGFGNGGFGGNNNNSQGSSGHKGWRGGYRGGWISYIDDSDLESDAINERDRVKKIIGVLVDDRLNLRRRQFLYFLNSLTFKGNKVEFMKKGATFVHSVDYQLIIDAIKALTFKDAKITAIKALAPEMPNTTSRHHREQIVDALEFKSSKDEARRILGIN